MTPPPIQKLAGALAADESLRSGFFSAKSLEEQAALATKKGYQVTVEDLQALFARATEVSEGPLSDADLGNVTGGKAPRREITREEWERRAGTGNWEK